MNFALSVLFLLIGCLIGWTSNHYYSIVVRRPLLVLSGGGGGSSIGAEPFHFVFVTVRNELRQLGFQIPETVILGFRIPVRFGRRRVLERDPARQCTAHLVNKDGDYVCQLWWRKDDNMVTNIVDINSAEGVNLVIFVRREDSQEYLAYQPLSPDDLRPKTEQVPRYKATNTFTVRISYAFGSEHLDFSAQVKIKDDGLIYFNSSSANGTSGTLF
jgi:hypothetical protein